MQSFLKTGKVGPTTATAKDVKAGSSQQRKRSYPAPWVEKYRPKTVEDIVEQNDVVAVLKQCINGSDLPHLLFYGPPGTGKTSTILAASKQLFGDMYKERILELNASDERGIQVIRVKVKNFAQLTASGIRPDGRPCPAFKIVILDEADSMTHAAQAALRRTMERETKSTRFCLICNYVSRIIEPLTSRCTKFRFKPLAKEMIFERLKFICNEENVNCSSKAIECLVETSGGDMRRAITSLQSCARLKGKGVDIQENDVLEVSGIIPTSTLKELLEVCALNDYAPLHNFVCNFMKEAYSAAQLFDQLNELIIMNDALQDRQKSLICEKLAVCRYRVQDGGSEYLQMMDLGCTIINTMQM